MREPEESVGGAALGPEGVTRETCKCAECMKNIWRMYGCVSGMRTCLKGCVLCSLALFVFHATCTWGRTVVAATMHHSPTLYIEGTCLRGVRPRQDLCAALRRHWCWLCWLRELGSAQKFGSVHKQLKFI